MAEEPARRKSRPWPLAAIVLLVLLLTAFLYIQWSRPDPRPIVKETPSPPSAPPPVGPPPPPPPAPPPSDANAEAYSRQVEFIRKAIEEKRWADALGAIPAVRALRDAPELKTLEEAATRGRAADEALAQAKQIEDFDKLKRDVAELQRKDRWDAAMAALEEFRKTYPRADQDEPYRNLVKKVQELRGLSLEEFEKNMNAARRHFEESRFLQSLAAANTALRFYPERQDLVSKFQAQVRDKMVNKDMCRVTATANTFWIGSDEAPDERPLRQVTLPAFFIDKYEVTNEEYFAFVSDTARRPPHSRVWAQGKIEPGRERHPVVGVTYEDAKAFAEWAGKRLPTAEEWEAAARGFDKRVFPWGDAFTEKDNVFLCNSLEHGQFTKTPGTMPVDAFDGPNTDSPFGVFGMGGNVWEWTSTERNGMRVLKGGSFTTPQRAIRCANILAENPELDFEDVGFRCVRD